MNKDRFKGASWFGPVQVDQVIVGGAGGIGSWLCLLLSRAGVANISLYDFDRIEAHNIGGQLFRADSIGEAKVTEVGLLVEELTGKFGITAFNQAFTADTMVSPIMFSAFDNMNARRDMFTAWQKVYGDLHDAAFIDGRLTMEHYQVFCIRGNQFEDQQWYEKEHLFANDLVAEEDCTMKQTSHSAAMIAAHMVSVYTNLKAEPHNEMYMAPTMVDFNLPMQIIDFKFTDLETKKDAMQDNHSDQVLV